MVQLSGIQAAPRGRALVDASFELPAFPGGKSFSSLSIPAGGVVLLPETRRVVTGGSPFTALNRRVPSLVSSPRKPIHRRNRHAPTCLNVGRELPLHDIQWPL